MSEHYRSTPSRAKNQTFNSGHSASYQKSGAAPISTHRLQLPIRNTSLQRSDTANSKTHDNRRVTFDDASHPVHRSRSRTLSNTAGAITPIDSRIGELGGTTSTLECLPQRLRVSKASQRISPEQRIEELTREAGHLRQELAYHKETRAACLRFFEATRQAQQDLHNAIAEMSRKVAISEQRFENYWRTQSNGGNWEEHVF